MTLRDEGPGDAPAVETLIARAFALMPFADGTEARLAQRLHASGDVLVALVAEADGRIVGQALWSAATVGRARSGWATLGPVAVAPEAQRRGIGGRLIREGLARLRARGAAGCIVEGDPAYYPRFGFEPAPALAPPGAPVWAFMALPLGGALPQQPFGYHPAFGA